MTGQKVNPSTPRIINTPVNTRMSKLGFAGGVIATAPDHT